jgi:DNA-binding PadR family transcriptional regulator
VVEGDHRDVTRGASTEQNTRPVGRLLILGPSRRNASGRPRCPRLLARLGRLYRYRASHLAPVDGGDGFPALSQLEDEGLVTLSRVEGRNTASLTEEGTAYVEAHRAELGAPWDDVGGGVTRESRDLRAEIGALMGAAHQVSQVGNRAQVAAAVTTLAEAHKALYRLLADDDPTA